jgi:hypothetical protein
MKPDFRVQCVVGNPKEGNKEIVVDALRMRDNVGIVLVWDWGVKDEDEGEIPVDYTQNSGIRG